MAANGHVQVDYLAARGRIALELNFKSQNFPRLKFGECGPNHWFARSFDLNLMGIKAKTAALIVFFDAVFIAIYAEQYLPCRHIKIFRCTTKLAGAMGVLRTIVDQAAAVKMGASKVVHQGVHQNTAFLLCTTALQNLFAVLPLKIDPKRGCAQHTQANGDADHQIHHLVFHHFQQLPTSLKADALLVRSNWALAET